MLTINHAEEEYRALLASVEYAYAMGAEHSGPGADHDRYRAVRERAADLRSLLQEHR